MEEVKNKDFLNTTEFNDRNSDDYKRETIHHWSATPCGSNYSDFAPRTKEYFEGIEQHRYRTHPWIKESIDSFNITNKKVLEIGFGMGTDHLNLARRGAIMHGIDLTPTNREISTERFKIYGMKSDLITGDAENLPYMDNSFDFVYSFGVIHHSPDTQRIISEIYRVLKPGGKCWITVYHKNSVYFWWSVFLVNYLLKGGWKRRTLQQQLSRIEYPGDNENMVIKLYTRKEFASMFSSFRSVNSYIKHLLLCDIAYLAPFYKNKNTPSPFFTRIGNRFGWYVVVEAGK